jgi:glycosyltransferase involved in cell wall biosynthesis
VTVLLDIQGTQSREHSDRGIARYLRELTGALMRWHPETVDAFLLNPDLPPPSGIEPLTATGRLTRSDALTGADGGVYHVGSPFEHVGIDRIWPPHARRGRMHLAVTVYDLIPEVLPEIYLQDSRVRRWYRARLELIRQADRILAISRATAKDVVARLGVPPARVDVVGAGVGDWFHPPETVEVALDAARNAVSGLQPGYILYTGGIEPRKNVERLLESYAALAGDLRESHQLVVVCRVMPDQRLRIEAKLARLGVSGRVLFPGYVSDRELVALYQACELFVFPSLYEGFGLPVAEALACGAPVLASGASSLAELVSEEAQFDPHEAAAITAAIKRALTDERFRAGLRNDDRPTWRDVAARTAEAYDDIRARRKAGARPRPRLAFVTPLPPQPSGVADASYRLLEALANRCDIDAFADGHGIGERIEARAPAGVNVASTTAFDRCERVRGGYDRVVYCLGNSEYHGGALTLLRSRPGIVLAHDLRLSGLYAWAAREREDAVGTSFHQILQTMYGDRIPGSLGEEGWLNLDDADRYGIFMARAALASSELFLVHSNYAAQLARLDAAPADVGKIRVIPFGIVSPDAVPRAVAGPHPLVATFGIASAAKQTVKIVESFATIAEVDDETRFAVVGTFPDPRERAAAERLADELGIRERIEFTGRVDNDDFYAWVSRTTIAVQLRSWSNGETSAAVTDCLAVGIPTVVTGIGSAAELPDDCVVKVAREIDARSLGRELTALLADPARRSQLAAAAETYARSNSFERAAEILFEIAVDRQPPRLTAAAA